MPNHSLLCPLDDAALHPRWTLAVIAGFTGLLLFVAMSRPIGTPHRGGEGDVGLYQAIVERVRGGENYYSILAEELPARGYPTTSIFNWRTPLPMWLIGVLPLGVAKGLLTATALCVVLLTYGVMQREAGMLTALLAVFLLIGALIPCLLGNLYVMPVVWSGTLIALSIVGYGTNRTWLGVSAGLAALFLRDLAAGYVLISLALAIWNKRWRELGFWCGGLAGYALFFAVHTSMVLSLVRPDAVAHEGGWVRFGGAAFLIGICQMNCFLLVRPIWLSALYLVAVLFGALGWKSSFGRRTTLVVTGYLVAFAVVGQAFNQYWGSLLAPLFCLTAARFPGVLDKLVRSAGGTAMGGQVPQAID